VSGASSTGTELVEADVEGEEPREARKERLEREHGELLQELRALIPGAQVLLGFLLAILFTSNFADLDDTQRDVYYATLVCTGLALVLFQAPAVYHRVRFREGDKDFLLRKANREAIAGSVATAFALTGVLYLVTDLVFGTPAALVAALLFFGVIAWRWWVVALIRSLRDRRR
jgi:Family of unknown function (DUF6328)